MKKLWIFSIFYFLFLFTTLCAAQKEMVTTIAFVGKNITQANFSNAKSAMKIWMNQLTKAKHLNVHAFIVYYDNFQDFKGAFNKGKIDSIITSPYIYLEYRNFFDKNFTEGWVKTLPKGKIFFDYDLIVRDDIDFKKQKQILVSKNKYNKISDIILKNYQTLYDKEFSYKNVENDSKAIINTFFKKSDACLVQSDFWKMAIELNPQIANKMHIVAHTKKIFVNMISLLSNTMNPRLKSLYFNQMQNINSSEEGKQLKNIFRFNGTKKITVDVFAPMKAYFEATLDASKR